MIGAKRLHSLVIRRVLSYDEISASRFSGTIWLRSYVPKAEDLR